MAIEKPVTKTENAHFLKGHASWLYCDGCQKTIAYLCYVTHSYFRFSFTCSCGAVGWAENAYADVDMQKAQSMQPARNPANKRFCCANDGAALFSPVPKNLRTYSAKAICKQCNAAYEISEVFGE